MLNNIKALVYVLVIASIVFWQAKPICLRFMTAEDFGRRRAVWLFLTAVAFLSPSFWLYVIVAIPTVLWAGGKDSNPAALFLLLYYAVPEAQFQIPMIFPFNHPRMLVIFLAIPALLRRHDSGISNGNQDRKKGIGLSEVLLLSVSLLAASRYWEYESFTSVTRRLGVDLLDGFIPFLLLSRTLRDPKALRDALAGFALCCALMVPLAVFEAARGWLIYEGISHVWGYQSQWSYLTRAGVLRAQLTTGHSLRLGLLFAMGFGVCLYLMRADKSSVRRIAVGIFMWLGLLAAYARGAWIAGLLVMIIYFWQLRSGTTRILKALLVCALLGVALALSPMGDRLIDSLPFFGSVDASNVSYRQQLFAKALELIPQNFWFGDLFVERNMESLRQGQGIVDIVNGYLLIALHFGMLPLMLVVLFQVTVILGAWRASRRVSATDEDLSAMGAVLVACILSALVFAWMAAFTPVTNFIIGMSVAYAWVVRRTLPNRPGF